LINQRPTRNGIMRDAVEDRRHELIQSFGINAVSQAETLRGGGLISPYAAISPRGEMC